MKIFLCLILFSLCALSLHRKLSAVEPDKKSQLRERLLQDRCILVGSVLTDEEAADIVAQLKLLASRSKDAPIRLFINSPGGAVSVGLTILDAMQALGVEVHTCCVGQAHSLAAIILAAGSHGHRSALKGSTISFSEVSSGGDITTDKAVEHARMTKLLLEKTAHFTHADSEKLKKMFALSTPLTASDAVDLGIIDEVVQQRVAGQ